MPEEIIDAAAGRVRCEHKRVAIIGAGATRTQAPWDNDSWCAWAINEIWQPRYDRHFELHPMAVQSARDLAFLGKCPTPCYVLNLVDAATPGIIISSGMPREQPRVTNAVQYPLDWVLEQTGGRRYFTCTFAYQVAIAIAEGFEEIGLWGVDLARGSLRERLVEAPCVEYWVGLAEGRSIKVTVPESSTLCRQPYLYGYDYEAEVGAVNRQCDEALETLPRARWPALLQRLGQRYGGGLERKMVMAAAELGRAGTLSCADWAALDDMAERLTARADDARRAFGVDGTESA